VEGGVDVLVALADVEVEEDGFVDDTVDPDPFWSHSKDRYSSEEDEQSDATTHDTLEHTAGPEDSGYRETSGGNALVPSAPLPLADMHTIRTTIAIPHMMEREEDAMRKRKNKRKILWLLT
jgi:hypothetical protein